MELIRNIDGQILLTIHAFAKNTIFDIVMPLITYAGELGIMWICIGVVLLFTKRYRYIGFLTLFSLLLCAIFGEIILKHIFQRSRPFTDLSSIKLLIAAPTTYSFPSGHTTASFAAAGILAASFKRYRIPIFLLASLVAFSRLYLLVHFPLDILCGVLLGLFCAQLTMAILPERVFIMRD